MRQLWEYSKEELAERCAIAECEIERLRAALKRIDEAQVYEEEAYFLQNIARDALKVAWKK